MKSSTLHHVGVIVRDLDKAIKYYESLGIPTFKEFGPDVMDGMTHKTMYGRPVDFKLRAAMAKMGEVELEVVQPVKDAPLMEDFLKSRGEGVQHIAFLVDNLEQKTTELTRKGYRVVWSARLPGGGGAVYLDTSEVGGVMIELLQW